MNIHVSIVTYNSALTIRSCIESLQEQTHHATIVIIDNASSDETIQILQAEFSDIELVKNAENRGFAVAQNQGIRYALGAGSDAVLVLNPDVILEPDYIERIARVLERNSSCGIAAGRLYRWDIAHHSKTDIIDSDGLEIFPSLRVADRHAGMTKKDVPISDSTETDVVFGVSGAACMVRARALKQVQFQVDPVEQIERRVEYFDERFFIYKEDVDLCWKLWLAGWDARIDVNAVGYHARGVKTNPEPTVRHIGALLESRKKRSRLEQFHSFKNQHLLVIKNVFLSTLFRNFFQVMLYETKLLVLAMFIRPYLIGSLIQTLRLIPAELKKRREQMKQTSRTQKDFQVFLNH